MKILKVAMLAGAAMLAGGAAPNWSITVAETNGGHLIGNPDAETKVAEYVSYTCSHCAQFARDGDPALKIGYVLTGKVSVEVRHLLRDPIDLTAAMLTHCGEPDKFALNHSAFMLSQGKWLPIAGNATEAQIARWSNPDRAAGRRALASDLDFYEIMEQRGYRITDVDRCLADTEKERQLVLNSRDDAVRLGIQGTPSFTINDKLLEHVHAWQPLQQALDAHIAGESTETH